MINLYLDEFRGWLQERGLPKKQINPRAHQGHQAYLAHLVLSIMENMRLCLLMVANVYGGVDSPSSSVKGTITGGAAGIEAKCGSYYRLKGVDWWGWVKISDTHR